MIVKCEKLFNPNTNEFQSGLSNERLTVGSYYSVIEIYFREEEVMYRMFSDDLYEFQYPFLVRANEFSVVSGKIPTNWELIRTKHKSILGPKMWNIFEPWEESFWQDWDNNLPKAQQCFDDELRIIFDCDLELIKLIDEQQGKKPYFLAFLLWH